MLTTKQGQGFLLREEQLEFEFGCPQIEAEYYREGAQALIQKLVSPDLLIFDSGASAYQRGRFADLLPIVEWSELPKGPSCFSALLLCKYRHNACHFFYEMISRWLLPHKKINVELFFASDVRLPHLSEELLSVAEVVIYLKSIQEVEEVHKNLRTLESEIRLGIVSHYHARRILEFKGLSSDGKTAMIQEKISSLIQNRSKDFDREMFAQMQQFLVNCPDELKKGRDYHHLSRMISNLHSVRKVLVQNGAAFPNKRHIIVKFLKTRIQTEGGHARPVLGVLVGLNFLKEHEVFEEEHLVKALQQEIPTLRPVEGSFFVDVLPDKLLHIVYLEVEQQRGADLSLEEVQKLRLSLPTQLKARISLLTHPIFMPRNEEEVLRHIMALSQELRSVNDIPQMVISFDSETSDDLSFTVILLRIKKEGSVTAEELFTSTGSDVHFQLDRVRKLFPLRKKHMKEAIVFRASLPVSAFLRLDHSVDLYQARQHLLSEITRLFGEVRDYNGGMICRQNELLASLKVLVAETHHLLLEKFFFSLQPIEMRTILEVDLLKQWFSLLLQAQREEFVLRKKPILLKQEPSRLYSLLFCPDSQRRAKLLAAVQKLAFPRHQLIFFSLDALDAPCIGFLLLSEERHDQKRLSDSLLAELK